MPILLVDDTTFDEQVVRSALPVLVDFFTPTCGPCKSLLPVLEELAAAHEGRLRVAKVDVSRSPDTAAPLGIMAVPTLVLFHRGKERDRLVGFKTRAAIERLFVDLW